MAWWLGVSPAEWLIANVRANTLVPHPCVRSPFHTVVRGMVVLAVLFVLLLLVYSPLFGVACVAGFLCGYYWSSVSRCIAIIPWHKAKQALPFLS